MKGQQRAGRGAGAVCAALALAVLALLIGVSIWLWQGERRPLLLAPAIGGLNPCLDMAAPSPGAPPPEAACAGTKGSAAGQVESILAALGPRHSPDGRLQVGYTLVVPLLNLFRPDAAAGGWRIDDEAVQRVARTVQGVDRPVVLYLFSSHFSEGAPIEPVLASDPANLAQTPQGPLPVDRYMGQPMYPWSVARLDNGITQRRDEAMRAVSGALCRLPAATRQRAQFGKLWHRAHHQVDQVVGAGFRIERQRRMIGHVANEQPCLLDQRRVPVEQRRSGRIKPKLADLLPRFVEFLRVWHHIERCHGSRLGQQRRQMLRRLAIRALESRFEAGIAQQQPIGRAAPYLRFTHEVQRQRYQLESTRFVLRVADRLH